MKKVNSVNGNILEHNLLKNSYSRWGKQLCLVQLLGNCMAGIALHLIFSPHNGAPRVLAYLDLSTAGLLCIAGILAFRSSRNGARLTFCVFSIMCGTTICATAVSEATRISMECNLHQLAFKGCSDFSSTPCSVDDICTTEQLQQTGSTCTGPTVNICLQQVRLVVMCGISGLSALVLHGFVASVALFTAIQPGIAGTPPRGPVVTPNNVVEGMPLTELLEELQTRSKDQLVRLEQLEEWKTSRQAKRTLKSNKRRSVERMVITTSASGNKDETTTQLEDETSSNSANVVQEERKMPYIPPDLAQERAQQGIGGITRTRNTVNKDGKKPKKNKKQKKDKTTKSKDVGAKQEGEIIRRMSVDSLDL